MAPDWVGRNAAPNDLWHLNRTLVVTYNHPITWSYNSKIWPDVQVRERKSRSSIDRVEFNTHQCIPLSCALHILSLVTLFCIYTVVLAVN